MTLHELLETVPAYARDLKLNLSTLMQQTDLTKRQLWGTAVACAVASRNAALTGAIVAEAEQHLSVEAIDAAKGAAAIMGMNNVWYRFLHFTSDDSYRGTPARLRMNMLRAHGVDAVDFELWCLAVSAINGCQVCVDSHEKIVREKGLRQEAVAGAVRIAAVLHGLAAVFDAETVAAGQPALA